MYVSVTLDYWHARSLRRQTANSQMDVYVCVLVCVWVSLRVSEWVVGLVRGWLSIQLLGCDNGGGGANFSKVKRLAAKWIGTRKRLFSGFFAARVGF